MRPGALPIAAESLPDSDLLVPLGGAAALLALLGLLLLLPLHLTQRRNIARLRDWRERDPDAGDDGHVPAAGRAKAPPTGAARSRGPMCAAERVTSERPALARIGTAERASLEPPSFFRRVIERGPRHPLVISLLTLLVAAALFAAAALLLRANDDAPEHSGVDRAAVDVVVVNASSSAGLAAEVADGVELADFTVAGTTAAPEPAKESAVLYGKDSKLPARAVARRLSINSVEPFDAEAEAAADGADVVVIAGEDRAEALGSKGSGG